MQTELIKCENKIIKEINEFIEEILNKSSSYEEALRKIKKLEWSSNDYEKFILKKAADIIHVTALQKEIR